MLILVLMNKVIYLIMKKQELEDVMENFVNYESDVLLCTTIIETGIDISNVNTIKGIKSKKSESMDKKAKGQKSKKERRARKANYLIFTDNPVAITLSSLNIIYTMILFWGVSLLFKWEKLKITKFAYDIPHKWPQHK